MAAPLLILRDICKFFGATQVLHHVNLTLDAGEILFLVGPSGCGKTTLLRIIAGFETPECGSMAIRERVVFDATHFTPPRERHLGYVLQEGVLFPHLSVWRNIAYGLGDGRGRTAAEQARIREVMALTDITELAERMPHQISGGQQQRVALARALAPGPTIMLLDEPFSALDEHLRAQIRDDVIAILRRSHSAAIVVTHDRHEALSCADKVGLLDTGHLLQLDTPQNIYRRPLSPQIARFIGDHSLLIPGTLSTDGLHAQTALAPRVPVEILSGAGPQCSGGQVLVRADQLVPVPAGSPEALCNAVVQRVSFHGSHSQIDLAVAGVVIMLDVHNGDYSLRVGDSVALKLLGRGIFYPDARAPLPVPA